MSDPIVFNPVMLRLNQLFALRPTLESMGVTQVQIDQHYQDVLNGYVEKLIVFFTESDASGVSRWRSLAQLLEQALRQAWPSREDAWVRRLIRVVLYFPDSGLRNERLPSPSPQVYLVERFGCQALAIIQGDDKALLCTLTRGIEVFDDVASMKRDTGVLLADSERLEHDVFEGWALGALEMTIQRIERVDLGLFPNLEQLDRQLSWASRFWDLFEPQVQQDKLRRELEEQLPAWLKSAPPEGRLAYSQYLERLASAHKRFKGMSVLDNVPSDRGLLRDIRTPFADRGPPRTDRRQPSRRLRGRACLAL